MGNKITGIYVGTHKVRPAQTALTYDFTQSDAGWNANGCSRDGRGFYRTNSWSDGVIIAPSEIFNNTPKKITITYNKTYTSSGVGIYEFTDRWHIRLPTNYNSLNTMEFGNSSNQSVNIGGNPTGDVTWEMTIDSSTTNWTVTHKIGSLTEITDNYGIIKNVWENESCGLRIVNRSNGTGAVCIKSATFEY